MSPYHWDEFQTYVFHVAPSMGTIVVVVKLRRRQNSADQLTKPGNGTVYVYIASVAIS